MDLQKIRHSRGRGNPFFGFFCLLLTSYCLLFS